MPAGWVVAYDATYYTGHTGKEESCSSKANVIGVAAKIAAKEGGW